MRQEQGWRALGALIRDLKAAPSAADPSRSVFDETTILAFSEFGRTPLFNNLRGRDHHLGNSCLIAGPGLKGGVTVGGSGRGLLPLATRLRTGEPVERPSESELGSGALVNLTPKHVLATILGAAGLGASYLRAPPIAVLLA